MKQTEKEIVNEKKLIFDSKEYLLKLINEEDLNQRINFNLTYLFTDQYEYSASLDYLEEKQKNPENTIFTNVTTDNSSFRECLQDLFENSKITTLSDNNINVIMEKSYIIFKKEKKYCYELELKKSVKNDNSNLLENDLNLIEGEILDQRHCQVCNLRFKKIQSQLLKLSERKNNTDNKNSVEIEALKIKCDRYEKQVEMGKIEISNLSNKLSYEKDRFENLEEQIKKINNSLDFTKSEFNVLLNKFENVTKDLAEIKVKTKINEESNVNFKMPINNKESESINNNYYNTVQNIVNKLLKKNEELERKLNDLMKENETIKKEYKDVLLKLDSINNNEPNKSSEYKILNNELIESKDLFNNKININQIIIDNIIFVSNDIAENNITNLDDFNFMIENCIKGGIKINKIKLIYFAKLNGFKSEDFIYYSDNKDNIILVVTLDDGERFSFWSEQGFRKDTHFKKNEEKMAMFNLTKKEYKLKNENDTWNDVHHSNQYENVYIGFKCYNSKKQYYIHFISGCDKFSTDGNGNYNHIGFDEIYYYKEDFTYSQIELYELILD